MEITSKCLQDTDAGCKLQVTGSAGAVCRLAQQRIPDIKYQDRVPLIEYLVLCSPPVLMSIMLPYD